MAKDKTLPTLLGTEGLLEFFLTEKVADRDAMRSIRSLLENTRKLHTSETFIREYGLSGKYTPSPQRISAPAIRSLLTGLAIGQCRFLTKRCVIWREKRSDIPSVLADKSGYFKCPSLKINCN